MAMQKNQGPQVLNKKRLKGAVPNATYIGRPSIWGNPFVIGKDGTRGEVIEKYERWLLRQPRWSRVERHLTWIASKRTMRN